MKKPSLRLRQVFEGPTHFKVVKPLGNPIKIAKKGLSPNLMGRLRKFAKGTGEVPEPTEQDEQNLADLEAEISDEPRRRRPGEPGRRYRPGDVPAPQRPRPFESDAIPGPIVQGVDIAAPSDALTVTPPAVPRPRPSPIGQRFVDVQNQQINDIKSLDVTEAAQPIIVNGLEYVPAVSLDEEIPFVPRGVSATGSGLVVPSRITPPVAIAPMDDQRGAITGRTRPKRIVTDVEAAKPVAAVEEVAPVQPTAVEAESPALAKEEPAPAEPSLFERALGLVNFDLAKYEAASPEMKPIIRQAAQAAFTAKAAADADVAAADLEISAINAEQAAQKEELNRLQTSADEARTIQKNILTDFDYLKNPTTYLGSMSTLGQIGTAISLAAGAFASGMTGMPNFAQKIYDNAIEQDLQAQKRRADSLYQRLVNAGNSVENAENMVRAQLKLVGAAEQTRRAAEIKLPQVKAKIQSEAAKQALDATNTMQRIAKDQAEEAREAALAPLRERKLKAEVALAEGAPEREAEKARMEKKDADLKESRLNFDRWQAKQKLKIDEERLKFDKLKMDQDISSEEAQRTFNVAGQPIQAKDKTQARNAEEAILGESEFIDLAEKTLEIFKEHPVAANVWNTTAYNTAKLFLGQLLEKYPKVERFRRPLNVTASKVVKGAMGSLQGLESAVFNRPEEVLGAMINEAKNARRVGIRTYARPTPDGQKQAEQAIKAVETPATEDLFE